MEALQLLLVAALGLLAVLLIIRSRQQSYKGHVAQLQPQKKRVLRQLTLGEWSRADVAQHSTADDCWLIIRDRDDGKLKVFDVTEYIEDHPGGMAITNNAGGDATEGFMGPQHPDTVWEMLRAYYIGPLTDP